jgi:hypothetical protein
MYSRALVGYEKVLILSTVNNLGNLYKSKGKLDEAEKIYSRDLYIKMRDLEFLIQSR